MVHSSLLVVMLSSALAKRALLVVDVQDCFLGAACTASGQEGSLAVPACGIVPKINDLITTGSCLFDEVIYSQDFHPAGHISYASSHGIDNWVDVIGKTVPMKCLKPIDRFGAEAEAACCPTKYVDDSLVNCSAEGVVCPPEGWTYETDGEDLITANAACTTCRDDPSLCFDATQALWSDHCLDTGDSHINAGVAPKPHDLVVKKGQNKFVDAYSAFMDNTKNIRTELYGQLRATGIEELYVVGIATDVCVKATVLDALREDTGAFSVTVISDATAAVLGDVDNHAAAVAAMEAHGATVKTVAEVLDMPCPKKALLVIDVQDCFLDASCTASGQEGSLAVPACGIVPKINDLITSGSCLFDEVIYSQDFHPAGHISYASSHGINNWVDVIGKTVPMKCLKITNDSEAGSACCPTKYIDDSLVNCSAEGVVCPPEGWTYEIDGADLITDNRACEKCGIDSPMYRHLCFDAQQALWSDHCLDTGDSQINAGVAPKPHDLVVKKGQNKLVDAYSAFMDNTKRINTELDSQLRAKGIKDLYVVGIATDVCVKETVLDAFNGNTQSYRVTVISDAMAAVLGNSDNHAAAVAAMEAGGATIKTVAEVLADADCSKDVCIAADDCSDHGTTTDTDKTDGCVCSCDSGFTGADCSSRDPFEGHGSDDFDGDTESVDQAASSLFPLAALFIACIAV